MRTLLFTLLSVMSATLALAATVYKWVDDNGVVHYSDQPHENSEKIQVQAPQTYSAPRAGNRRSSSQSRESNAGGPVYRRCAISQPANDESFVNADSVGVGVSIEPGVRPGDQVVILLDGQRVNGLPPSGTQFTLSPVDRGSHTVQAVVQDANGQTLCASGSVTFHVHQPSVLNPLNPVNPAKQHR
jgi:hypothetical protein